MAEKKEKKKSEPPKKPEKEKPYGKYNIERLGAERILRVNYIGAPFYPSIENDPAIMEETINKLIEAGTVTTIIFEMERNYVYPYEQTKLLNEVAEVYFNLTRRKPILQLYKLGTDICQKCVPKWYETVNNILVRIKRDPIGAYVEVHRRLRETKARMDEASSECKECMENYAKMLNQVFTSLGQLGMIQQVKKKLAGHEVGSRQIYSEIFEPMIKPNFMYTRLMAEPPSRAEQIDAYTIKEDISVTIYSLPGKSRYVYHIVPTEFLLNEEEYILLDEVRNILIKFKPKKSEFIDPARMREIFFNISKDLVEEVANKRKLKISYESIERLARILVRLTVGFGLIEILLSDLRIEDVYINAPVGTTPIIIKHGDYGECETNILPNLREAEAWASRFRMVSGRPLDEANPVLDTELTTRNISARVSVIQQPLSPKGYSFAFRSHRPKPFTFPLYLKYNYLSPTAAGLLSFLIDGSRTMLVAGTRGAGKSSLLGSIMVEILRKYRQITVEDSVTGDMRIVHNSNHELKNETIKDLFNKMFDKYGYEIINGREILDKNPEKIRVYSVNDQGKINLSLVSRFIRHKVTKPIYEISTSTGRCVKVTGDHSLFTVGDEKTLKEIKVKELKQGDFIATPRLLPHDKKEKKYFDLSNCLKDQGYVIGKELKIYLKNNKEKIKKIGKQRNYSKETIRHWIINGLLPVKIFKELRTNIFPDSFKASHNSRPIPLKIKLNDDLLAFIGLWLADGCYDKESIIISVVEPKAGEVVKKIAKKYKINLRMHSDNFSLMINSSTLRYVMREIFELKGSSYTKRIPSWIFDLSKKQISYVLKGLFTGKGSVSDKEIILQLASKELLEDVQSLLLYYGIIFKKSILRRKDKTLKGSISALRSIKIFKKEIRFLISKKQKRLSNLCNKISTYDSTDMIPLPLSVMQELSEVLPSKEFNKNDYIKRNNEISAEKLKRIIEKISLEHKNLKDYLIRLSESNVYWDKIIKIKKTKSPVYVYDFCVPNNENFVCSNVIAHNTLELPVDYMRKLGFNIVSMKVRSAIMGEKAELSADDGIRTSLRLGDSALFIGEVRSSIKGDQEVIVVEKGLTKRLPIKELESRQIKNIKVPTLDENLNISLHNLKGFVKHPPRKKLLKVTTKTGREIIVTPDHSLFTQQGFKLGPMETNSLETGDKIVIPASIPCNYNDLKHLDLTEILPELRLEGYEAYLKKAIKKIGYKTATKICKPPAKNDIYIYLRNCSQKVKIPINKFKKLMKQAGINYSLKNLKIKSGTSNTLTAEFEVSKDFCRFLGYYVSEGYVNKDFGVIITNSKKEIIEDVLKISKKLFSTEPYVREVKGLGKSTQIIINNLILGKLILKLGSGRICTEKRIPPIIYGLSKEKICAFLKGLYSGEGSCTSNERTGNTLRYFTTSKKLADDLLYLLLTQKIVAGCSEKRQERKNPLFIIQFKQREYINNFLNNIGFTHKKPKMCIKKWPHSKVNLVDIPKELLSVHIKELPRKYRHLKRFERCSKYYLSNIVKDLNCSKNFKSFANGDFYLDEIKEIKELNFDKSEQVYDLSVNPTQNFIGGFGGIILHNTEARSLYESMRIGAMANVVAGTIHGDSPYGVFDRVVNDLQVPPTSFKATDIIVIANKLRSPDMTSEFRRVTEITELRKHWTEDPMRELGFVSLMEYDTKKDMLVPTNSLLEGESDVIKSIAGRVREWAGKWDVVWDNILLRGKIKKMIYDYYLKTKNPALLEADFEVLSNDVFHKIFEKLKKETGYPDSKDVVYEFENWLRRRIR